MTIGAPPICTVCSHLHPQDEAFACDAYPDGDGIPMAIILGEADHHLPYPGDHGIVFKQDPNDPVTTDGTTLVYPDD